MLNLWRIIIERLMFRWVSGRSKKYAAERRKKLAEQRVSIEEVGAEEWMKQYVRFRTHPLVAAVYLQTLPAGIPLFWGLAILATVIAIAACIWMVVSGTLDFGLIICVIILLVICYSGVFGGKYLLNYMENTETDYYFDRICIKHYGREDKVITYEELKKAIVERKIIVRWGRFEFPYEDGIFPVYTFCEPTEEKFYQFINKKCGIKIPKMTKKENDIVRRAGFGQICIGVAGIPINLFSILGGVMVTLENCSFKENWNNFIAYMTSWENILGILGTALIVFGVIWSLIFIWPVKRLFKDSEDIIKVKLF